MNEGNNSDDMQINISDIDDNLKKNKEINQENVDKVKEQNKMEENEIDEPFAIQESDVLKDEMKSISSQGNEISNKEKQNNQHNNIEEKVNNYLEKNENNKEEELQEKNSLSQTYNDNNENDQEKKSNLNEENKSDNLTENIQNENTQNKNNPIDNNDDNQNTVSESKLDKQSTEKQEYIENKEQINKEDNENITPQKQVKDEEIQNNNTNEEEQKILKNNNKSQEKGGESKKNLHSLPKGRKYFELSQLKPFKPFFFPNPEKVYIKENQNIRRLFGFKPPKIKQKLKIHSSNSNTNIIQFNRGLSEEPKQYEDYSSKKDFNSQSNVEKTEKHQSEQDELTYKEMLKYMNARRANNGTVSYLNLSPKKTDLKITKLQKQKNALKILEDKSHPYSNRWSNKILEARYQSNIKVTGFLSGVPQFKLQKLKRNKLPLLTPSASAGNIYANSSPINYLKETKTSQKDEITFPLILRYFSQKGNVKSTQKNLKKQTNNNDKNNSNEMYENQEEQIENKDNENSKENEANNKNNSNNEINLRNKDNNIDYIPSN